MEGEPRTKSEEQAELQALMQEALRFMNDIGVPPISVDTVQQLTEVSTMISVNLQYNPNAGPTVMSAPARQWLVYYSELLKTVVSIGKGQELTKNASAVRDAGTKGI